MFWISSTRRYKILIPGHAGDQCMERIYCYRDSQDGQESHRRDSEVSRSTGGINFVCKIRKKNR